MSVMPNEPLVRLALASHWNFRNDLIGWRLFSWTNAKAFNLWALISQLLENIRVSYDCPLSLCLCVTLSYKQTETRWVMVPYSLINGWSTVSAWWIITSFNGCASNTRALTSPVISCLSSERINTCVSGTAHLHASSFYLQNVVNWASSMALCHDIHVS